MAATILLTEDDDLLRELLSQILAAHDDLCVVGTTATGAQALEAITELDPDVLLLDIHLPDITGLDVLDRMWELNNRPRTLVLSGAEDGETQLEAAERGAQGFLQKSEAIRLLPAAIRSVASGGIWFSASVLDQVLARYQACVRARRKQKTDRPPVTAREREVLVRLAQGMTNRQIAADLCMSLSTVKTHVQSVLQKLDLPNRTEAAVYAVREGLLVEDDVTTDSAPRAECYLR